MAMQSISMMISIGILLAMKQIWNPVKGFTKYQDCIDFVGEDYDRADCYDPICVFNRPLWEKNNWKKNIWCDNF